MFKLGLKLWSTNLNYIKEAWRLYDQGFYQYLELFAVPETYDDIASKWANLQIPYVIHAPHFKQGLNFADKNCFENNKKLVEEALRFADKLNSEIIIFHPGADGDIAQTAMQIKKVFDSRMVIENKPYFSFYGKSLCNGYSPQEIEFLVKETGIGFCLDFAHAIFAANALKFDKLDFIDKLMRLKPKIFHITDGQWNGVFDEHPNLGQGSFEFDKLKKFFLPGSMITIETKHNFENSLKDFEDDVCFLKRFLS
jgi:sugar phosphate isomerase/epimerase